MTAIGNGPKLAMKTTNLIMNKLTHLSLLVLSVLPVSAAEPAGTTPKPDPVESRRQMHSQILARYDANKNGKLEAEERAVWHRDLEQLRREKSARFDFNKDGKFDAKERAAAQAWLTGQTNAPAATAPSVQRPSLPTMERQKAVQDQNAELIRRHDKNGDGQLDEQERDALWTEWRLKLREKKTQEAATNTAASQLPK